MRVRRIGSRHDLGDRSQRHPSLFAWPVDATFDKFRELCERGKSNPALLKPHECAFRYLPARLLYQMLDALRCQAGCLNTVERRWITPLLDVPEDGLPNVEETAAFALEESLDEGGFVDRIDVLAANHEPESFAVPKSLSQVLQVDLKVVK